MSDSIIEERRTIYMYHEGIRVRVDIVDFGVLGPTKAYVHAGNRLLCSSYPFHTIGTAKELGLR